MPNREIAPVGSPCWADLWTSDVEGSRKFYGELFGWTSQEPDAEFGGYFIFEREGVQVAGGMGDMGDMGEMQAANVWKPYLATDDIEKTAAAAEAEGAEILSPAMAVAELGTQVVLNDPTGAHLGAWQAGTFQGFTVLGEHGSPGFVELHTRDFAKAISFYTSVFHWETTTVGDTDEFRYATLNNPDGGEPFAGIMDASGFLPDGVPSYWGIYWATDDIDATVGTVKSLGGSVVMDAQDTPYGRLSTVADPFGAEFKLRQAPA